MKFVFSLSLFSGISRSCRHHLLSRVKRPAPTNSSQREEDRANLWVEQRAKLLRTQFRERLEGSCGVPHTEAVIGELWESPFGEALQGDHEYSPLTIWYTPTEKGFPKIVLGVARDAEDYWQQLKAPDHSDLLSLGPTGRPRKVDCFFVTDTEQP